MSRTVQVPFDETEFLEIREMADRKRLTLAEWIRAAVHSVRPRKPRAAQRKLEAVNSAARHSFPAADIDQMLAEIEQGYDAPAVG